ncbi:MAG: class I SAM-dependent methyltransferase, partial [Sulfuricella sp.]
MTQPDNATPFDAAQYAQGIQSTMPYYDDFQSQVIDLVQSIKPDVRRWLDTGCGDGYLIEKARPHFPDAKFYAADPADSMLTQAKIRLKNIPQQNLVMLGPAGTEDLTLDDGERPEVISAILSHHYLDRETRYRATRKCFDLLAENGVYITFENIHPDTAQGLEIGLNRWERFQIAQGREPEAARR